MSDSVRPHRRQPNRLPRPWYSPDKNTGMGCHFLLQCVKVKSESEVAQSCPTLSNPMDCSPPGSSIWLHQITHSPLVVVQSLSQIQFFFTSWIADHHLPHSPLSPRVCSNSCPLNWWCYLTISSSVTSTPFAFNLSQHQGLFQWLFAPGGQSIGALASVSLFFQNSIKC